jgi:HK97 family phage major capsid protein
MNLSELRSKVAEVRDEIVTLSAIEEISVEDDAILTESLATFETLSAELAEVEARSARIEAAKATIVERASGVDSVQIMKPTETALDMRTATRMQIKDAALKVLELDGSDLAARQGDSVESLIRAQNANVDGTLIAKRILATETPAYRSAFAKALTSSQPAWTTEEARAISEYRAASEGTDSAGGFGVPVFIDSSIILTSGAAAAPVYNLARKVSVTTDEWKGVSSAGVTFSYDSEAAAVSDDAATLAQPTITIYKAAGFIPFSLEVGDDYPAFAAEMRRLLDSGFIDLVASGTVTGSTPVGIFTALDANTNVEVSVTTDGAFGAVDVLKLWKALPERSKANASWIMSTGVENEIRKFAASSDGAYYTVNLAEGGLGNLFGRPVYTTDYAPDYTATTGAANICVVGDFSNFVVAQRAGMTVELVPHLFDVTNNRPTGQRGFYAVARHGYDSVNDLGFRLLQNT